MAVGVAVLLSAPAGAADDDLAVVKKAVASPQAAVSPPAALQEERPAPASRKAGKPEPQWLKVRTFAKGGKGEPRKRVSVNLPLSLVRALDDFPIDLCRHHRREEARDDGGRRCEVRLADVLSSLEAGQELVEVEGEDETVKIWVE
jgi:hypothetical protein